MANALRRKMFKMGGNVPKAHGVGITSGLKMKKGGLIPGKVGEPILKKMDPAEAKKFGLEINKLHVDMKRKNLKEQAGEDKAYQRKLKHLQKGVLQFQMNYLMKKMNDARSQAAQAMSKSSEGFEKQIKALQDQIRALENQPPQTSHSRGENQVL